MIKTYMIKALAELEGVQLFPHRNVQLYKTNKGDISVNGVQHGVYDPILDLALNCQLRDKYEVNVNYYTQFDCGPLGDGSYDIPYAVINVGGSESNTPLNDISSEAIALAIIECILKSKERVVDRVTKKPRLAKGLYINY